MMLNTPKIATTFRAFKNRNYALYFSGQSVSLIGTWMQSTSVSWVVYSMTHSAFMVGASLFASRFPSFIFSLYGGILADRHNRFKMLLITQVASMVQAVLMAVLIFTGRYTVPEILILSTILGTINAFDVPARQPLVHELVNNKDDLPNALAFNSSMVHLARFIGPGLSGIVLQRFGAGICFSLNALSFLAVITSLLLMKLPPYKPKTVNTKISTDLAEGFTYIKNTPAISTVLLLIGFTSLFVLPYEALIPVFAKVIYNGDAATYGYIRSFIGLGAVGGALLLASLKAGANLKRLLLAGTVILGVGLALFSHISYFPLAMVFAVAFGFGNMAQNTICLTIIQVHSDPKMRGRVIGYLAMVMFGLFPIGSLIIGAISQKVGAPDTILAQGIIAVIIAIVFTRFLQTDNLKKENKVQFQEAGVEEGIEKI